MRGFLLRGALSALLAAAPASAQLAIDRLWVDFIPGVPNRSDIVIRNESKDRYFISVAAAEIHDAGSDRETRVTEPDPEKLGLLVTPNRLVVDPGGQRSIRLVSLNGEIASERVYRVTVTPQVGEIVTADPGAGNRGIAIKVLAAYDLLVTVRPKGSKASIQATRSGKELLLKNVGTTNALLFDAVDCGVAESNESKCIKIGSKRLYSGNEWKITLKAADDKVRAQEKTSAYNEPKSVIY